MASASLVEKLQAELVAASHPREIAYNKGLRKAIEVVERGAYDRIAFSHHDIMLAVMKGCRSLRATVEDCNPTTQLFLSDVADAVLLEILKQ